MRARGSGVLDAEAIFQHDHAEDHAERQLRPAGEAGVFQDASERLLMAKALRQGGEGLAAGNGERAAVGGFPAARLELLFAEDQQRGPRLYEG